MLARDDDCASSLRSVGMQNRMPIGFVLFMAVHSMDSPVISHSPAHVHHWRDLAFLHWRVPEAALRPLVPSALEIDTFDGSAWIGLVLFTMPRVRIRG